MGIGYMHVLYTYLYLINKRKTKKRNREGKRKFWLSVLHYVIGPKTARNYLKRHYGTILSCTRFMSVEMCSDDQVLVDCYINYPESLIVHVFLSDIVSTLGGYFPQETLVAVCS